MRVLATALFAISLCLGFYSDQARGSVGLLSFAASAGASPGALVDATIIEPSGSDQTNVPFCLGLPFAPGTIDSSHHIKVVDSDTGLEILAQEDNRASDLSSTPRFESLCGIDPSITANEAKKLVLSVAAGAPATGTDITVADLAATAYDLPVAFDKINGTTGTWAASPTTALTSGNSGWVNTTTATVLGEHRSGGGLATEFILFVPAVKSGTADAQMRVVFDVLCWKASRAAVSGGNPILGCRTDAIVENGYTQASAPTDNWYGLSVGTAGAVASFPNSTPSITLTLANNAVSQGTAITAGSSLFSLNSQGMLISDGTGVAVINNYTNATHAQVNVYKAFASTTVGSGTYTLYGINHPYAARFKYRGWWAPGGTPSWPSVEANNLYLGDAWNSGTLAGGPGAYFMASKLEMNYAAAASSITNSLTELNAMGTNPSAYQNGGGQFGSGGQNGDLQLFLETSGERGDIGVVPDWDAAALIRYDSNADNVLFGDANRWATYNSNWRDQNTGLTTSPCNAGTLPTCSGTVTYVTDSRFTGTLIHGTSNPITPWSGDGFAHDPEGFYTAYLLTGDFFWLESQMNSAFAAWAGNDPGYSGTGITKTVWTNQVGGGYQERGRTWALRTITDATLLAPDAGSSVLGWQKGVGETLLENEWVATDGLNTLFVADTGTGKTYATDGPRWTTLNNNGYSSFEVGYGAFAFAHQYEQGMLSTNGVTGWNWYAENETGLINSAAVSPEYTSRVQYESLFNVQTSCPGTMVSSWGDVYTASAAYYTPGSFSIGVDPGREPNTTLTLSAVSGTSVTATLSGGGYFATTSFYPGMWISGTSSGAGRIVSVTNSNTLVIDTTASNQYFTGAGGGMCQTLSGSSFGSTTLTAGQYVVPMPAPGDPVGLEWANYISSPNSDYLQIVQADTLLADEYGLAGGTAAHATSWGFTGGNMSLYEGIKWNIQAR